MMIMSLERDTILKYRRLLKAFDEDLEQFPENFQTDQQKKIPNPPLQKPHTPGTKIINLVDIKDINCGKKAYLYDTLEKRRSHRSYTDEPLTLEELSFLLWTTLVKMTSYSDHV